MQILVKPVASEKASPRTSPRKKENGVADKRMSDVSCMHTHGHDVLSAGHSN